MSALKHLRAQVKRLLLAESNLSEEERKSHQWQLLTTVGGVTYIVGKGGANTMVLKVGDGEQQLCLPQEALEIISSWQKKEFDSYAVCHKSPNKILRGPFTSVDEALSKTLKTFKENVFIIGLKGNKASRLYVAAEGLQGVTWKPFVNKAR